MKVCIVGASGLASGATRITEARNPVDRGLTARTFSTIRELSGFSLFQR